MRKGIEEGSGKEEKSPDTSKHDEMFSKIIINQLYHF